MKSTRPINPALNWHLSAMQISRLTAEQLEQRFFFQRDLFANNTHCEATAYHGTFHGEQKSMTRALWNDVVSLLASDSDFEGDLEEELILSQYTFQFASEGDDELPLHAIKKQKIQSCPIGVYKACDIHLKVIWDRTQPSVRQALDDLGMISFDRQTEDQKGFNRIYTLTFESLNDGLNYFEQMKECLALTQGIQARLKLEIATCFYRQPENAVVLPIVRKKLITTTHL